MKAAEDDDPRRVLIAQRDHMLRQATALENKVAGLNMAIAIISDAGGNEDAGDVTERSHVTATRQHT